MHDLDYHDPMEPGQHHVSPAAVAGFSYAAYRHGQDRQTEQLIAAMQNQTPVEIDVRVSLDDEEGGPSIDTGGFSTEPPPDDWDSYIGQRPMKRQLRTWVDATKAKGTRLPHVLLASGRPGVGKTTMARLLAKELGVRCYEIVPPFRASGLIEAVNQLDDGDILFIDEIHLLTTVRRGDEILLKLLEDGVLYDGVEVVQAPNITIIGATTEPDALKAPVLDRFPIKPYFEEYTLEDLVRIVGRFMIRHGVDIDDYTQIAIAKACRRTPRIIDAMVQSTEALQTSLGRLVTPAEMLDFNQVEPDGMTRQHIQYLLALLDNPQIIKGQRAYVAGEMVLQSMLRETRQGLAQIERFLMEQNLIDRTPRGRQLSTQGLARARQYAQRRAHAR